MHLLHGLTLCALDRLNRALYVHLDDVFTESFLPLVRCVDNDDFVSLSHIHSSRQN